LTDITDNIPAFWWPILIINTLIIIAGNFTYLT